MVLWFYGSMVLCSERKLSPRFADVGSVEFAVAEHWKAIFESEKCQREELEQQLGHARNSVLQGMESLEEQHQTKLIRQELAHHQQEQLRLVQELRMRQGGCMPEPSFMEGGLSPPPPPPPPVSVFPMHTMDVNQEVKVQVIVHVWSIISCDVYGYSRSMRVHLCWAVEGSP